MPSLILPPKTFLAYSLGCRTNQAEIEDISLRLMAYGLRQKPGTPDIILLNTCVVTAKAEKETRQKIRELRKKYPKSFLVVLGCGVTAKEEFNINLPEADLYILNKNKDSVIKLLKKNFNLTLKNKNSFLNNNYIQSGRNFIKIQDGCDKSCSFCLTCYLRGIPKSIPPEKIIEEINFWVKNDIKEIILTGINIGLYHNLTGLLNKILKETKIERISFSSIYPEMLTDEFLKIVVDNPRISQYFHLSLQSGSQTVLQRMNRKTDLNGLLSTIKQIKTKNQFFTFRADIIIGFPNETEEEFKATLEFIKKNKISFVHSFPFSIRPDTKAEGFLKSGKWQDLPKEIKKQRQKIITNQIEKIKRELAGKMTGQVFPCLIVREKNHVWESLSQNNWPVAIRSKTKNLKGKIFPVKIIGFNNDQLLGEIVSLPIN